jgi:dipeptidyl aminopeptidase/acylaminoacyl peptidase
MRNHARLVALLAFAALSPLAVRAAEAPADEVAAAVSRMARIGSCYSPSFSPDAKRLAVVCNLTGSPQVWMVPADGGGWPELVTPLDDQVGSVEWSPDGAWLAFTVAPGGGLNTQVYLVRPDGRDLHRITEGGKINNGLSGWSPDGKLVLLSSNRTDPASLDSYVYDVEAKQLRLVAKNPGVGTLVNVSADGKWGVVDRVKSRGDNNLFLVELATGKETLLTPHTPPASFGGGWFSPDGRTIYLASNRDSDLTVLAKIALGADGKPDPIQTVAARDGAEIDDFRVSRDGTLGVVIWDVGGRSELVYVDLQNGNTGAGPKLPGEIAGGLELSADGLSIAFSMAGARLPTDVWVLDKHAEQVRQVTHSPHAGVDLTALVAPRLVTFPAHDGLQLSGWLYPPPGAGGPGAVVISFHGGPEGQERPGFNSTYQALLARGIGVFAPNVRGSAGFGKRFVNLDNGALRVDSVKDIKACVDFLVARKIADPKRIGIMGGSYGGYMTMAGLTEYPDLFAAGADLYGIVNFETFFSHTEAWMAAISTIEYGDPVTQKEMLASLSPIHRLDRVKAPTLVLHGANDTNVPVVEAEQVAATLKQRGVPVEYVLFPEEGHGFRKAPNRIRSAVEIVRWFEKYLQPEAVASAGAANKANR